MRLIQRVLHAATDISEAVNDFRTAAYTFAYTSGQYLYVGAEVPFNHLWIETGTANDQAAALTVEVWFANAWVPVVDLFDGTKPTTVPLAHPGRITWALNRLKGWDVEQDSGDVTGLSGVAVYDFFWLRMSWSTSLKATTSLKYVGQKFSTDTDLFGSYPDLNNSQLMAAFAAGKTDWNEQAYMAAEAIARDLIKRKIVRARGQVFDYSRLVDPSVHKVAELIYRGCGPQFDPQRKLAVEDYGKAMDRDFFRVDANADGFLEPKEKATSVSYLTR